MLADNVKQNNHDQWVERFKECYTIEYTKSSKKSFSLKPGLTMGEAVRIVGEKQTMKPFWLRMSDSSR